MVRKGRSTTPYLYLESGMERDDRSDLIEDILDRLEANPSVSLQYILWKCSVSDDFFVAFAFDPPHDDLVSRLELTMGNYGAHTERIRSPFRGCSREIPIPRKLGYVNGAIQPYFIKYIPSQLAVERFFGPGKPTDEDRSGGCIYTVFITFDPDADSFRAIMGYECAETTHPVQYDLDMEPRNPYKYLEDKSRQRSIQGPGVEFGSELPDSAPDLSPDQIKTLIMPPDPAALSPTAREHVHHFNTEAPHVNE